MLNVIFSAPSMKGVGAAPVLNARRRIRGVIRIVTIYEYRLATPQGEWLISQIWNADCAAAICPTRLMQIAPGGQRTILVDDMMHQVIPPDDPGFSALATSRGQAAFAEHPFDLADDGKTLVNGDYKFQIGRSKP